MEGYLTRKKHKRWCRLKDPGVLVFYKNKEAAKKERNITGHIFLNEVEAIGKHPTNDSEIELTVADKKLILRAPNRAERDGWVQIAARQLEEGKQRKESPADSGGGGGATGKLNMGDLNWEIDYDSVEFEKNEETNNGLLGKGSFGYVQRAKWRGVTVAVKTLFLAPGEQSEDFTVEVEMLCKLRHPHLVQMLGYCSKSQHCLITEYVRGGSLEDIVYNKDIDLQLGVVVKIAHDICAGMIYMHAEHIVHRDLKPGNILVATDNIDEHIIVKIADFGISKRMGTQEDAKTMTQRRGTPLYMAPEVIRGINYDTKADVYSFGIIIYELISREQPFQDCVYGYQLEDAVLSNRRPEIPLDCPAALAEIIEMCWDAAPERRPSFDEVQQLLEQNFGEMLGGGGGRSQANRTPSTRQTSSGDSGGVRNTGGGGGAGGPSGGGGGGGANMQRSSSPNGARRSSVPNSRSSEHLQQQQQQQPPNSGGGWQQQTGWGPGNTGGPPPGYGGGFTQTGYGGGYGPGQFNMTQGPGGPGGMHGNFNQTLMGGPQFNAPPQSDGSVAGNMLTEFIQDTMSWPAVRNILSNHLGGGYAAEQLRFILDPDQMGGVTRQRFEQVLKYFPNLKPETQSAVAESLYETVSNTEPEVQVTSPDDGPKKPYSTITDIANLVSIPWFWGWCNSRVATNMLRGSPGGTFMVRFSSSSGAFSISMSDGNNVRHWASQPTADYDGYQLFGRTFPSIEELVMFYSTNPMVLGDGSTTFPLRFPTSRNQVTYEH